MFKPFDAFVTRAWQVLLEPFRAAHTHLAIQVPKLEADFFIAPGPALPAWMGLLGALAADGLLIGESETGYLTEREIETARLKAVAAVRQFRRETRSRKAEAGGARASGSTSMEQRTSGPTSVEVKAGGSTAMEQRTSGPTVVVAGAGGPAGGKQQPREQTAQEAGARRATARASRQDGAQVVDLPATAPLRAALVIIAEHATERLVRAACPGPGLERREPGLWVYVDRYPVYIVSLTQLAFRDDTAVLHALCRGPQLARALTWLMAHPDPQARACGRQLREELFHMQARVHEEPISDADRRAWSQAYQAFEDALLERGRLEEALAMCLKIWHRRFGVPAPWVMSRLQACTSTELLEAIADAALTGDLEAAEAEVTARLPAPPAHAG